MPRRLIAQRKLQHCHHPRRGNFGALAQAQRSLTIIERLLKLAQLPRRHRRAQIRHHRFRHLAGLLGILRLALQLRQIHIQLARLITGNAIGLVLSGGGARGFAHIGVIRALGERGIPIDYIGGTSMGAVIAAQHALDWDWQTMARVNKEEWPRCEPQKNYTLPLVALNSARRMDQMLKRMFGDAEIENLRRKFFCVSTNLSSATAKIHREGKLWKAVRASVSIPGIGPPAIQNGEILVDGGLVDNLPVETMKRLCQGKIYAVDVGEQVEFTSKLKESYTVSGWKLLWQQLNPFIEKPDIPNILNTLYRTT
ncbi:MAG: patatin-like phospholipase family protein, partial [Deltaproteobacteria bacterium]|nr:patatin-like phospholipase family protein [Deltaproteobacteria bacterium]